MNATKIQPRMILKLKPERQEAYGMDSPLVEVLKVEPDRKYKRFWVVSTDNHQYPASDFKCEAGR